MDKDEMTEELQTELDANRKIVSRWLDRAAEVHQENIHLRLLLEESEDMLRRYRSMHELRTGTICSCPICQEAMRMSRRIDAAVTRKVASGQ